VADKRDLVVAEPELVDQFANVGRDGVFVVA